MASASTYYCWHCYAVNHEAAGACRACGQSIASPPGTSYAEQLIWALGHPLPGRQMIAAQILGQRRESAAERPLRQLVDCGDPFLAAQALHSLVLIVGADQLRALLHHLAGSGAPAVSRVATIALGQRP
jgi:hypothetical protein